MFIKLHYFLYLIVLLNWTFLANCARRRIELKLTLKETNTLQVGKTRIYVQENGHEFGVANFFSFGNWLNFTLRDVNDEKRRLEVVARKPKLNVILNILSKRKVAEPSGDVYFQKELSYRGVTSAFSLSTDRSSTVELCWKLENEYTSWFSFYGTSLLDSAPNLVFLSSSGFALGFEHVGRLNWKAEPSRMCVFAPKDSVLKAYVIAARDINTAHDAIKLFPFNGAFPITLNYPNYLARLSVKNDEIRREVFSEPIWEYNLNELKFSIENMNNFLLKITEYSSIESNKTLIHFGSKYQTEDGNFVTHHMDSGTFHREFYRADNSVQMSWPVSHYISNSSAAFKELSDMLVRDFDGHVVFDRVGAGRLNLDRTDVASWFAGKLSTISNETGLDSFRLEAGKFGSFDADLILPKLSNYSATTKITPYFDGKRQNLNFSRKYPLFFQIDQRVDSNFESTLQSLIPTVLSLSLSGQEYIVPNLVFDPHQKPSPELYIRWIEAVSLMPIMKLSLPPWTYDNQTVNQIVHKFTELHREYSPVIVDLAKNVNAKFMQINPIIRPLWFVFPDDYAALHIKDQFMLGNDTLVAPVLREGVREREVYLPKGVWVDQHEKKFLGLRSYQVQVPLDELAYFELFEPSVHSEIVLQHY